MTLELKNGNCLELMKSIPDKSIDLMICDLPYGETNCKWDNKIDMDEFWTEFKRIRKSARVACIHFCSTKFGYQLIKSWEKGFKMDMVWKKRNKTGGLQSRNRPMRNHEMVYFFYDQCPKYNRDTYHKRIEPVKPPKPTPPSPNPASVVEEEKKYTKEHIENNRGGAGTNEQSGIFNKENIKKYNKENGVGFTPPNPASVLEEETTYGISKEECLKSRKNGFGKNGYEPPNPASVVEEKPKRKSKKDRKAMCEPTGLYSKENQTATSFEPPNPASVVEEEDEPVSMFESKKVFIGKRHHQTEKPLDILEFFIKYWTDEDNTILDPTMGSGSTGVACKSLNRNFIGFELDPKIFKIAEDRINKTEKII